MTFGYQDGIALLQLIAFVPCLFLAILLCYQQGMKAVASCWRFLIILACLRIAGAVCQLITITDDSIDVVTTKITCDLLGIAPLTLAAVGLLQRVNASINKLSRWIFIFVSIVSLVGLALGIAGAIKALDSYTIPPMLQAALGMFVGCLGLLLTILGYLTIYRNEMPRNEKIILYSVYACAPLLIVRTVYGCLGDYTNIARFNLFEPNPTVNLCMGVLEEIILMIICLAVGFYCPPPKEPQTDAADTTNSDETNIVEKRSSPPSDTHSNTIDTMNKEKNAEEGRIGTSTAEAL
ncbi:hypothetical protein DTO013E5_7944 [Penicillium roqueforti]|nr:hypothetical protein CBS147372_1242 [Penicillium roqueforti]KAI2722298.1 hypothetical protein CBS147354_5590 [Penicillium roqueforti]KAI2742107.1 hypothetical protein DTO012A1_4091 [Penicillium roqueforti]KAI2744211.1 hypothetical protein DTO013F2_7902 [Penicillium roqueforti]KAI2774099.1 hypothetical protein DTO012A8_1408 [Penicillium roqueforti]